MFLSSFFSFFHYPVLIKLHASLLCTLFFFPDPSQKDFSLRNFVLYSMIFIIIYPLLFFIYLFIHFFLFCFLSIIDSAKQKSTFGGKWINISRNCDHNNDSVTMVTIIIKEMCNDINNQCNNHKNDWLISA